MKFSIRLLYLYLMSFVGLLVTVVGSVRIVELGLKVYVFKGADVYEYASPKIEGQTIDVDEERLIREKETIRQRQREVSGSVAMIVIGVPLYLYHWKTIQKENSKKS